MDDVGDVRDDRTGIQTSSGYPLRIRGRHCKLDTLDHSTRLILSWSSLHPVPLCVYSSQPIQAWISKTFSPSNLTHGHPSRTTAHVKHRSGNIPARASSSYNYAWSGNCSTCRQSHCFDSHRWSASTLFQRQCHAQQNIPTLRSGPS